MLTAGSRPFGLQSFALKAPFTGKVDGWGVGFYLVLAWWGRMRFWVGWVGFSVQERGLVLIKCWAWPRFAFGVF